MKKYQITLFAILLIGVANSQSWKILTNDNNRFKLWNLSIVQNDTLIGTKSEETIEVPIQNISSIRYYNFHVGFGLIGVVVGAPVGMIIGLLKNYEKGVGTGLALGAVVGGIIFTRSFGKRFTLKDMTLEQKVDKINKLIEKYEK